MPQPLFAHFPARINGILLERPQFRFLTTLNLNGDLTAWSRAETAYASVLSIGVGVKMKRHEVITSEGRGGMPRRHSNDEASN